VGRTLLRARMVALAAVSAILIITGTGCQTTSRVAFVNPSNRPLYVQVDEHSPFEVPAGGTVQRELPALERLQPLIITARDVRGATVFAITTSFPRIEASGRRIEMAATGVPVDPVIDEYPGMP